MKTDLTIPIILYHPESEEADQDLAKRIAGLHTDMVNNKLHELECPACQKKLLLQMLIQNLFS